jgi:hypothetical protein
MWERVGNMPDADYTSSMRSYYFSGMCLRHLGRFEDALRIFERVAEQFAPGEFTDDAYYLWAACCCHLAQYGEAREASQRLIERYPKTQLSARAQANITRIALSTLSRVERDEAISFFDAQHDAWLGIRSGSARYSVEMRLRRGDLCAAEHMGTGTFEFSVSLIDGPDLKQHPVKIRVRWYDEANKRHYLSDNIFDSEGAFSCWRDGSYRPESKASQVQNGFMGLTRLLFTPVDLMAGTYTTSVWDDHLLMSKNDFFAYRGTPIRRDKPTGMGQATGSCYLFMPHSRPSEAHYWLDGVNGELRQIDVLKYRGIVRQLRYDDYFKNQIGGPIFPRRFTCCFKEGDGLKADGWEYTLELSDVSLNADIPAERFTRPGG